MGRSGSKRRTSRGRQQRDNINVIPFPFAEDVNGEQSKMPGNGESAGDFFTGEAIHPMFAELMAAGVDEMDLARLAANLPGSNFSRTPWQRQRLDERYPQREQPVRYQLRIDIADAKPPIWRRLEVHSDIPLSDLHWAIQVAFGWEDSHFWRFTLGALFGGKHQIFVGREEMVEDPQVGILAEEVTLEELVSVEGDRLKYVYDYGDDWRLHIKVERIGELPAELPQAICVGGRRAAPPENCGHLVFGNDLATVLEDPTYFDEDDVNAVLLESATPLMMWGLDAMVMTGGTSVVETLIGSDLLPEEMIDTEDLIGVSTRPITWLLEQARDGVPMESQVRATEDFLRLAVERFHQAGILTVSEEQINRLLVGFVEMGILLEEDHMLTQSPFAVAGMESSEFVWAALQTIAFVPKNELDQLILGALAIQAMKAQTIEELRLSIAKTSEKLVKIFDDKGDSSASRLYPETPLPLTLLESMAPLGCKDGDFESGIPTGVVLLAAGWLMTPTQTL